MSAERGVGPSLRAALGNEPAAATSPEPVLTEHEYDGIREYDNPLPRWWVLIFWGSFWFSLAYYFHYHLSPNGTSVLADYEAEMREARELEAKRSLAEPVSEESLTKLMADASSMGEAKALFGQRCAPCHGDKGQGVIGPNLTDDHWLHERGTLSDIYGTVQNGVTEKGMPAWGRQLTPSELRKVVAFVGSLRGTHLPGKPPEGTPTSAAP